MKFCIYLSLAVPLAAHAFYLPGAAPRDYAREENVALFVNTLTPGIGPSNALKSLINYDFYDVRLPFHQCSPSGGPKSEPGLIGSILFGDRIFNSAFDIQMRVNKSCSVLCTPTVSSSDAVFINERIREDYTLNWLVDGLPAAEMKMDVDSEEIFYDMGFNLGNDTGEVLTVRPAIHNHFDIVLKYHTRDEKYNRVVGVLVWPSSIGRSPSSSVEDINCRETGRLQQLDEATENRITFTYSISWEESEVLWATRWDNYLHIMDPKIHWFSLINSVAIAVFLCFMVSTVLVRSIHRDINRYNAIDLSEDVQEDYGWKLLHGEVFRPPQFPMAMSVMVGNGSQLAAMVGVTLVFALFGFLSPSRRGNLATIMLVFWALFGFINGYVSNRVYESLGGTERRKNIFFTAFLLPTVVFSTVFLLNFFLIGAESSGAVPFGTMLGLVAMWFLISVPLTSIGAYMGNRHGRVRNPVSVNQIPRQIPPVPKYLRLWTSVIISGILPFGAAFMELYYVFSSFFASKAYYAFGFLALTAATVVLTTATITILFTYFVLCAEDYRWQWRSFLTGGGSAFWVLTYGIYYWLFKLSLDSFASTALYLGYLFITGLLSFIISGTIGFLSSWWAVRRLYSSVRID